MNAQDKNILVVDDDIDVRDLLETALAAQGFKVHVVDLDEDSTEYPSMALAMAHKRGIDVAVCDLTLPSEEGPNSVMTGIRMIKDLRRLNWNTHIVAISGKVDLDALESLKKMGVAKVHAKNEENAISRIVESVKELAAKPKKKPIRQESDQDD